MFRRLPHRFSTYGRVVLSCTVACLLAMAGVIWHETVDSIDTHRAAAHRSVAVQLELLTLLLAESAAAGDQNAVARLLAERAQHPGVERIEWTDTHGRRATAIGVEEVLQAPEWFVRLIDVQVVQARRAVVVGGLAYGEVTLRESLNSHANAIWRHVLDDTWFTLLALALLLITLLLITRRALLPLRQLVTAVSRFGAGDLSSRAAVSGAPEVAACVDAFNDMAGQIEAGVIALRTAEQKHRKLATIVEQTSDAILTRDMNGRITFWNRGAERLFGWTAAEALGRSARDLHMRNLSDEQFALMRERTHMARTWTSEGARVTKTGETITVEATVAPLCDEHGNVIGAIGSARDTTERHRMGQMLRRAYDEMEQRVLTRTAELDAARHTAEQASRVKGEFLANMSHEVRTPMNGVLGMLGILLKSELSPRQRHLARTAHGSGVALLKVLNDILDFSKIEAGKLELELIDFPLRERVHEVVQLLAPRAHEKGLEIACRVNQDVPDALRGDPGRLRQVLANLIGNAIKFTETGEVLVRVGLESQADERVVLRFSVRDSGFGIDPAAQARIFEPFTQADAGTTRRFGGTGLGLTVSRSLVTLLGGDIGVDSVVGEGSTFWFTVSMERGHGRAVSADAVGSTDLSTLRVIAAERNVASREVLTHQLHDCGVIADVFATSAQALAQLDAAGQASYHVALLSLNDDAGLRWIREVRNRAALDSVRVILLSSSAVDVPTAQLRELRIDCVLNKPVSEKQLQHALRELAHSSPSAAVTPVQDGPRFEARILVVDDYVVNQEIARDLLEDLGCRVDVADNGREAAEATTRERYDLVLMDCQMPEMDGFQSTAAIRRREAAGGPRLPIVALTAHAMRGDRDLCLAAGMDDYLSKPFEPEQLRAILERWLTRTAPHSAAPNAADAALAKATAEAAGTVLDLTVIAKLRAMTRPGKPNPLHKWIGTFLSSTPMNLHAMTEAGAHDDAAGLQRCAHTLRSGAAQFGAYRFSQRCAAIEALGKSGIAAGALEEIAALHAEYEPVRAALEHELNTGTDWPAATENERATSRRSP